MHTGPADKILRMYGENAVAVLRSNPYRLAEEVLGVGFKTADGVAQRVGMAQDSPERIGGALTLKNLKSHMGHSLLGASVKLLILPLVGCFFLKLFDASMLSFQVAIFFFALPTSPAIIVLSSQLNSDTEFASAAIVLSTLLSFFSMSVVLLIV